MSNIDLGTLEYGFALNLTTFGEQAQRLYRELGRMDEGVQARLDKIGLRADQAGKTVQRVARDVAAANRAAEMAVIQATTQLRAQEQVQRVIDDRRKLAWDQQRTAYLRLQRAIIDGDAAVTRASTKSVEVFEKAQRDRTIAVRSANEALTAADNKWRNSLAQNQIALQRVRESTDKLAQANTASTNTQLANNDKLSKALRTQYEHKLQYDREEEASEDRKLRNFESKQREYVAAAERRNAALRTLSQQAIVVGAVGGGLAFTAGRQAAAFQQQQARLVGQYGESPQAADAIGEQVRAIGRARGADPTQAMAGFIQLRAMGRSTAEALKELDTASLAAFGHMAEVPDVIKTVNQTMQSYNVKAERAGDVTDILSKEITETGSSWKILGTQMAQSETQAKSMGVSLQDLAASFVTVKQAGIPVEAMGNQWTAAMSRLVAARKQTRDAAHEMNLAWIEHGQVVEHIAKVGYPAMLAEIEKATKGSPARIMELFGGRGSVDRSIIALIQNADKLKNHVVDMHHAQGAAAKAAAAADDTLNGQLRKLNANFHDLQISMGKELLPSLTKFLQNVNGLFNAFNRLPEPVKRGIALLGMGVVAGVGGLGIAGTIALCIVQITKLKAAMLTLGLSGGVSGALSTVRNLWSGAAGGANMATMIAGGGIAGAIGMATAAAITFGAAYWVGSYIAKLGGIEDAWKRVKDQQTHVLAAGGGVPELLQAATYVRQRRLHPLESATQPSAGGWDALQQQLRLRHLTTLEQATPGQMAGIETDLRGVARGLAVRRGPAVHPHAAGSARTGDGGTAPILGAFSTAGSVMAGRGARTTAAKTVAERIARAAEAMLGQPGGALSSQELINAALRRAGVSEHALSTGAGQADLARIAQRTTAPRRGDIGYSGQQAFVVRGKNPDGSLNVVFDPAGGGQDIHTYHIAPQVQSAYQFYRPGVFSGQENQALQAQQRRAAVAARQAARQAAALRRRQQDAAFATERRGAVGAFDGQIQALEAQPATVERLQAIERLMEQKNSYVAGLALRIARAHGTATDAVVANLTQGLEAENRALRVRYGAKETALRNRAADRTSRQVLQGQAAALAATRSGIKPGVLSDLGRTQLTAAQIDTIAGLETGLSENRYQQNLLQLPTAARGDANDARVQAFQQAREARNTAIEDQRKLRLGELQDKIEANDRKQQGLIERQISAAITNEERRLRYDPTLSAADRARRMGAFIQGQTAQPLRDAQGSVVYHDVPGLPGGRPDRGAVTLATQEGLDRFGAMATEQTDRADQLDHAKAFKAAHEKALAAGLSFASEKDKSKRSSAIADALQGLIGSFALTEDERTQVDDEIAQYRREADAQAGDFADKQKDYFATRGAEDVVAGLRGQRRGGRGIFGLFGSGVSRDNQVKAAELMKTAIEQRQKDQEFGYDSTPYLQSVKKQVDRLTKPRSLWDDFRDDAQKKFGSIAESFSDAVGQMVAKGGNLKSWWKNLWGEIVSWFTSYAVKSVITGVGRMFGARPQGGGAMGDMLAGLREKAFGGGGGGGGGLGALVGALGNLGGGEGGTPPLVATPGGIGSYGSLGMPDFSAMSAGQQAGGLGPTISAAAGLGSTVGTLAKAGGPLARLFGGGFAGGVGSFMSAAAPWLAAVPLVLSLFHGNPLKKLFGHKRFLGIKFDDPVNDFHAAASGRDFTQLFLQGVSHEMATRTASLVAPSMPGYMAAQARSGQQTVARLQPVAAGDGGGGGGTININHPLLLNRQAVDTLSDHVDRNLANRILSRSRRGTYGGRDRL